MSRSPFKFLDSYGKEDAATFFGREQETDELYARCTHAQTLVIYGRSGTGKTSLVQCGLRSRFDESDWLPIVIRRGSDLNANLLNELRAAAITPSKSTDALELVHNVYLDHFVPVYLIFDQFEEVFIFGDDEEQQTFITTARELIEKEQHVRLLFIVREEYLAQFTAFEEQVPSILEHRMRVERMPRRRAAEVVEKLCATAGIPVEPGFSAALLDRLSTDGGGVELSYVQVLLDQCWKKREGEEPFSLALLERIGQLDDVLGDLLDEQIGQCSDPRRAEALLKAFVSDQGTKRPLTDPEAEGWMKAMGQPMEVADLQRLLQDLVDRRLLTERDESGRHELRHDALAARIYERITKVEKEVADVRSFVTQAHKQFTKRGQRLAQTDLDYLRPYKHQLHLPDAEERFVEEAFSDERDREKRARSKRRWMVVGLLGLMVLGGLFTLRTVNALAKERRMSESVRLVQRAEELVDSDPQAAYLLAERAFQLDTTVNAERALLRAYNSLFKLIARYPGTAVTVAPDHGSFLSIDPLNSFSLCDTSGKVIFSHDVVRPPQIPAKYVADGRYVLSVDSTVRLFDLSGKVVFSCPLVNWHGFNDRGGFVAAYKDSVLMVWNGTLVRVPFKTRLCKKRVEDLADIRFGSIGHARLYAVSDDSLFFLDPNTGQVQKGFSHSPLGDERTWEGTQEIMVHKNAVYLATRSGTEGFDVEKGRLDLDIPRPRKGETLWFWDGFCSHTGDKPAYSVIWDLAVPGSKPARIEGNQSRYFPASRTMLFHNAASHKERYTLFDLKGKVIAQMEGRIVGDGNDDERRGRNHFILLKDATVKEDSIRVFRSDGTLAWSTVVPKITPHLWYELPALTFDEVGDSVTVCYFHNNVINGRSLQECRIIRNGRTIFYTTKDPFYFYWDRFVFNVVGNDKVLLSRWRDGFELIRTDGQRPGLPGKSLHKVTPFRPTGCGIADFSGDGAAPKIDLTLLVGTAITHVQLDTRSPEYLSAVNAAAWNDGEFYPDGRYFHRFMGIDTLPTQRLDFIWRTSDGSRVDTKWTKGSVVNYQRSMEHPDHCLFRNDSLLLVSADMTELLWAAGLGKLNLSWNIYQDRYITLTGPNGHVRIIDLLEHSVNDTMVDTTYLDPEILAMMKWSAAPGVVVENDSVWDLVTPGRIPALVQRVVNGKPKNVVTVNGRLDFRDVRGKVYMDVNNNTSHRAFDDVEFYGNFTSSLYRLDTKASDLVLTPVLRRNVFNHESEVDGFNISRYDVTLFGGGLNNISQYDEHLAVSTHRLIDRTELFPKDAATVIQYVREKKTYGEFWKSIDTEALFKEPE